MEALIPIMMFLSIAAVAIFRPLTKRLGLLLEAQAEEKRARYNPQLNPHRQQQTGLEGEQVRMWRARLDRRLDVVLSNSFGFGGTNACLLLRRLE